MKFARAALVFALGLAGASAHAATKTLTFIEMNDLHANLVPHKDRVADGQGGSRIATRGGLTRIATQVKKIRAENPNSVLMNVGDTYHGGVEAMFSMGNAIVDPLNSLGVDVGVPGNWDFYYSPAVTRARYGRVDTSVVEVQIPGMDEPVPIKRPSFPNIAANVKDISDPLAPEELMPPTFTKDIGGVKVGFVGLTSDIVEKMHPMLAQGLDFAQGETEHKDLINQHAQALRNQGAKIVVVMSELGIHKDRKLADVIQSGLVNVIFSAHTHEAVFQPISSASGALVVESGHDTWLGRMDITVDVKPKSVTVQSYKWQLYALDDSVAEDPAMKVLVDAERAAYLAEDVNMVAPPFMVQTLTAPINTVIGHTDTLLDRKDALESNFSSGLTDMMRGYTGSELALHPGFRMGATVAAPGYLFEDGSVATGDVTIEDVFRLFPMYYTMATGQVTGATLRKLVEETLAGVFSSAPFNHGGGWFYGFSGLALKLDLAKGDGKRVVEMRRKSNGALIGSSETLSITGCRRMPMDYPGVMCGLDGFTGIQPVLNPATNLPWNLADVFMFFLSQQPFNGSRRDIVELSNTPRWPQDTFVQPLYGVGPATPAQDGDTCGYFKFSCTM